MLEQAPGRTCGEKNPRWSRFVTLWSLLEQFLKGYSPWEGLTLEQFMGGPSPMGGTPHWSRRKERQKQHVMNGPQPPFLIPLCRLGGGGRENWE